MRLRAIALFVLAVSALAPRGADALDKVDLALVLAADVSRSVEDDEFLLQRNSYVAALKHPRVLRAIASGQYGAISLCFVEWSGMGQQRVIVDWTLVHDAETAQGFSDQLRRAPRAFYGSTAIGEAIEYSAAQFARVPIAFERSAIDVSGDGTNVAGLPVRLARDDAVAAGHTINALVILSPFPQAGNPWHTHPPEGLGNYFRDNVIGGPGAFHMEVEDFESFADAIIAKLIREVANLPEGAAPFDLAAE